MDKRSYKEAVEIMINWWIEKSFKTSFNQNNGDSNGLVFALMNSLAGKAQDKITESHIAKFKEKATEILLASEEKGRHYKEFDVDYNPNRLLAEICEYAEVDTACLPVKTFTYITEDNIVTGRYQYGGEWFEI